MAGLDSTGFTPKTLTEILAVLRAAVASGISPTLNTGSRSPLGEVLGAVASEATQVWEAIQVLYAAFDIDQATDAQLSTWCRLRGTTRKPATSSQAYMTITLDAGTYAAGSLIVNRVGDSSVRFSNVSEITVGSTTTLTGQIFACETTGPVHAGAGTLTVIASPVTGFSAPTNPADAQLGANRESDADLLLRSDAELARKGSSTVDAARADLLESGLFSFVATAENDTDTTDAAGRPPHSIEALLVLTGTTTSQQAADAVFAVKPAGVQAYGTTVVTVTDTQGNNHSVGYSVPSNVNVYISVGLSYTDGKYAGDAAVSAALVDWAAANLSVGYDVFIARLTQIVMSMSGVQDCDVRIGTAPSPTGAVNLVVAAREIARVDASRIAITSTAVVGHV